EASARLLLLERARRQVLHRWTVAEEAAQKIGTFIAFTITASALLARTFGWFIGRTDLRRVISRDVHDRGLKLLGEFAEFVPELRRAGHNEWRRVGSCGLSARSMHTRVDESADHNPDGERDQKENQRQQFLLTHYPKPAHGGCLLAFLQNGLGYH